MILLDDFFGGLNITTTILAIAGFITTFLFYRVIKNGDDKLKEIVAANKAEIDRINKHLESTDTEVEKLKDLHNTLNIDVIKRMNEVEKGILAQLSELSLKIEQWKNKN